MTRLQTRSSQRQRGLSLIELMIAMVLGLLVVGGAIGIFLSNQQTYRATESLGRIQENARIAFELMARDLREAGGNPCGKNLPVANVLQNPTSNWWSNWGNGVMGTDGGTVPAPGEDPPDTIELMSATAGDYTILTSENGSGPDPELTLTTDEHDLEKGDILMVCDYSQASIFQMTGPNSTNSQVVHSASNGGLTPGNCTKGLGLPLLCTTNGTAKTYGPNSKIVKMYAARWYIADNGRGGRSLYRARMEKGVAQPGEEIAEGIHNMQIKYLLDGAPDYVDAAALNWKAVTAVRIVLDLKGIERVGTDSQPLQRQLAHVVTLRNRAP